MAATLYENQFWPTPRDPAQVRVAITLDTTANGRQTILCEMVDSQDRLKARTRSYDLPLAEEKLKAIAYTMTIEMLCEAIADKCRDLDESRKAIEKLQQGR